jgi:hypothetical protein
MTRIVKDFDSFSNEEQIHEDFDVMGLLGKTIGYLGDGFIDTIKQKFVAMLMEKLGIREKSIASEFLQQVVSSIDMKEWPGILSGDNRNMKFFIPKIAEAIQFTLERKGFEGITDSIGLEPNGLIVRTIVNTIQDKATGKERIEKFLFDLFGEENVGGNLISSLDKKDKQQFSDALSKVAGKRTDYKPQTGRGSDGGESFVGNILGGLLGGNNSVASVA